MTGRRDPYLILGIDHGADAATAGAAFARAARRVRTDTKAPFSLEDITWALHRIEQAETDPDQSLDTFRVPANPDVYLDAHIEELLPASAPLDRTSEPGAWRQQVEDQAVLEELRTDLIKAAQAALQEPIAGTVPVKLGELMGQAMSSQHGQRRGHVATTAAVGAGASQRASTNHWWILGAVLLIIIIGAALATDSSRGGNQQSTPPAAPQADVGSAAEAGSPRDSAGTDLSPAAWVRAGDCLIHVRGDEWQARSCGGHDAEIVLTRGGARTDVCPGYSDIWFQDDWGVYCALIVTDSTPEGGHWGIGPVHADTCLDVDRQGNLLGKTRCTGGALPVLALGNKPDDCDVYWAVGDYYVYFEPIDGTSNYLCVDGYDWDRAGLP